MPEKRLERTRRAYDVDYDERRRRALQFEYALHVGTATLLRSRAATERLDRAERHWRALHENAGEQLRQRAQAVCLHDGARYDISLLAWVCRCGARLEDHTGLGHWNVIEGGDH